MRASGKPSLQTKGVQQSSQLLKDSFVRVHEPSVLQYRKTSRGGRKLAWLGEGLLFRLRGKKDMHR